MNASRPVPQQRDPRIGPAVFAMRRAGHSARRRADVSQGLPDVAVKRLPAAIHGLDRAATWLAALCIVASSVGCVLTQDVPDPALDIPNGYKAARLADSDAPPTLDWWRGFRSRELTDLMEEAQTVNLDIAAAIARFMQADAQARDGGRGAAAEPERLRPGDLFPHLGLELQRTDQWRTRGGQLFVLAQRQLRARFLGQEPRRRAGGGGDRDRQPLRSRRGGAHDADQRRQCLFPGAGLAGPAFAPPSAISPARRASSMRSSSG